MPTLLVAAGVGLAGGVTSGLLGTSPGGALVVLSTLLLGADQRLAQGISLAVQIPPTGVSGIRRYRAEGHRCPLRWLLWLAAGMLAGGAAGAIIAAHASTSVLRWSYAGYLIALDLLLILRSAPTQVPSAGASEARAIAASALLLVGLGAGLSSGFLGIGGGLVIVVGLSACLKMPQHQAQMIGLILTMMPTTVCAAYIYWRAGQLPSWPILVAVIVGLWGGTDLGARLANHMDRVALRRVLVVMVTAMALYMAWRALTP
ncbi:MAG: sulfite exporter TauE/SafE family protein [Steroidobacteraceae bacterium]